MRPPLHPEGKTIGINVTIPVSIVEAVEERRGDVSRSVFVADALRFTLNIDAALARVCADNNTLAEDILDERSVMYTSKQPFGDGALTKADLRECELHDQAYLRHHIERALVRYDPSAD